MERKGLRSFHRKLNLMLLEDLLTPILSNCLAQQSDCFDSFAMYRVILLIEAMKSQLREFSMSFSQSLASRLHRLRQANALSTTHRFGKTTNCCLLV